MENSETLFYILNSGDSDVQQLLSSWCLEELIPIFNERSIDIETLKYLTLEDICVLVPIEHFSLRVKFRQKLLEWRQEKGYAPPLADTISSTINNLQIIEWLNTIPRTSSSNSGLTSKLSDGNDNQNQQNLDLKNILHTTLSGKKLLIKESLSSFDRKKLVEIICENWINHNYFPKHADFVSAANEITTVFVKEDKEIYLGTKANRGILIQRYYTLNKKFQSAGLLKSRYKLKKRGSTEETTSKSIINDEGNTIDDDVLDNFEWLKHNKTPEHLVIEKWKNSFKLREKQKKENLDLFVEWPILQQRIASELVELDFEKIYPSKSEILYSKWDIFLNKINNIYKNGIKDTTSKLLLERLNNSKCNINKDSKDYYYTILLNAILVPSVIKEGTKPNLIIWKPTITDGQRGLVIFVNDIKDVPQKIKNRTKKYLARNLTIQPFIVTVGDCEDNIESCYIYYNEIFYECGTFLKALSLCFQIHQILNIKYASECIQVWHFIELYFFNFQVTGKKSSALIGLINDLKD